MGLTDDLIVISILNPLNGSYSQAIYSFKGEENRPLSDSELFKVWMALGMALHNSGELKGWKKDFIELHATLAKEIFNELGKTIHMKKTECPYLGIKIAEFWDVHPDTTGRREQFLKEMERRNNAAKSAN